ncbi:MAG: hypothetical protein ACRC78_16590 [Planktothrix sp.]
MNHPWRKYGRYFQPDDGESNVQAVLAKIGFHRYRLNINQTQMAELLTVRFKKPTVSRLTTQELETFLTEIEKVISLEQIQ